MAMLERWERERRLFNLRSANPRRWMETDTDRLAIYKELRALGYRHTSARKLSSPLEIEKAKRIITERRRVGASYEIALPSAIRTESDIEKKVKVGVGMLGEWRLRVLGEKVPSLEAEIIAEAKQVQEQGGDVDAFIEGKLNMIRREARAVRSHVPIEGQIAAPQALPEHVDETERYLTSFEDYAWNMVRDEGPGIDEDVQRMIVNKAIAPIKDLLHQGVELTRSRAGSIMGDIAKTVKDEVAKALQSSEEVRSDNPTMYHLRSTNPNMYPYKTVEGKADFVTLMMIASRAAKAHNKPKPKTLKEAVRVLDYAGFRVAEVK